MSRFEKSQIARKKKKCFELICPKNSLFSYMRDKPFFVAAEKFWDKFVHSYKFVRVFKIPLTPLSSVPSSFHFFLYIRNF